MKYLSVFDIVGPSMIGPSSSHTAGAVRMGLLARRIYGRKPAWVKFTLYNSFAKTGKGHGTDKALIAGILGYNVNDPRIKNSYEYAREEKINVEFAMMNDPMRHPNAVDIKLYNEASMLISGNSLGAGEVAITSVNRFKVNLRGDYNTLMVFHKDQPGMIWKVTKYIQDAKANIAFLQCDRNEKGGESSMVIGLDSILPDDVISKIQEIAGVYMLRNLEVLEK